jgi:hypothetical protein
MGAGTSHGSQPAARRLAPCCGAKPSARRIVEAATHQQGCRPMNKIMPIALALVPLAFVLTACITCP